jgi:DUF1365 family protein
MSNQFRSYLCRGDVAHQRLHPRQHKFTYPMTFFVFDLDELTHLHEKSQLFHYNTSGALSLKDGDYLHGKNQSIREGIDQLLPGQNSGERVLTVTSPRYFGYAFNPVNFHLRMDRDSLRGAVAEVNNTFGDRHVYPLQNLEQLDSHTWQARSKKQFHVSPFNNMSGEYLFTFRVQPEHIHLGVDLYREGTCVMKTWLSGDTRPLTSANIWKYALLRPFDTALNSMPRILWQALQLKFQKQLPVHPRPAPGSPNTLIDRDQTDPTVHVL